MKRLLLALVAVSCIGIGLGVAQNINKALQLSQDPSGAFGVDTVNSVFVPNHIVGNAQLPPTVSVPVGTITVVGTDLAGTITGTSAIGTVTLTFRSAYGATPVCVVQSRTITSPLAATPSTTGFTMSTMGSAVADFICIGNRA